jgi:hypothetical protein
MDIKAKIDELVQKLKADDGLAKRFFKDPIKTLEDLLGVDLPDEQVKALIEGIKAKLNSEEMGEKVEGFTDKVEGLADKVGDKLGDVADKLGLDDLANKVGDKLGDLFGKK